MSPDAKLYDIYRKNDPHSVCISEVPESILEVSK